MPFRKSIAAAWRGYTSVSYALPDKPATIALYCFVSTPGKHYTRPIKVEMELPQLNALIVQLTRTRERLNDDGTQNQAEIQLDRTKNHR